MPFKRLLCTVDFSPESLDAFRVAVGIARLESASLHVLHVVEAQPVSPELPPIHGLGEVTVTIVAKATTAMDALVTSAESDLAGLSCTTEVTTGAAFAEILDRAGARRSDLIVLGPRGVDPLETILLGSTAERVMQAARCSVLVARES